MPMYDFQCPEGHTTEKFMSVKDETQETPCEKCEATAKRIISAAAFHFKCGGFYETDYKRQNTTAGSED